MSIALGDLIPDLSLPATGDKTIALRDLKGQNVVLYFYPKDSTPGCTTEGRDFSALFEQFSEQNSIILGVSRDSMRRHENFKAKQEFKFDLLSDEDEQLCQALDVIKLKKLYGREYMGIDRSTFVFNQQGELCKEWRKVKVKGHAQEVLDFVTEL